MMQTDLTLAKLCLSSETDAKGFDYIDDAGVWWGVVGDPEQETICFRGSVTAEDWWRDAHAELVLLQGSALVHSGFVKGLRDISERIKGCTSQNRIITGHSLGAARAAIMAAMIGAARVVLFGCPRPGNQGLADALKDIPITSYKNRLDPVTDVPVPLLNFPYTHARPFTAVDGMVDYSLGWPWNDHHIANYVAGLEKLNGGQNA